MSVKIREKKGYLYLDVIQGRTHHWESLHIKLSENATDRKEQLRFAESCRAKRELQLALGEWNFTDTVTGKKLLIDYIEKIAEKKCQPYKTFVHWVKKYKDGGRVQLQSINDRWVYNFQQFLVSQNTLSELTINHIIGWLRYSFNIALQEGIINKNPALQVKNLKVPEKEKDTLSIDEVLRLYKAVPLNEYEEEVKRAFLFSCYTGLRFSDLRSLQWKHIESRAISKYNQCRHWIKKEQVKTKNVVEIPLSESAYNLIQPMGFPDTYVFSLLMQKELRNGNKIGRKAIARWAAEAEINKKVSWHTARRTFATLELESGADPFTVQRLMGHKSITMTGIYAKSNNIKSGAIKGLENMLNQTETTVVKNNEH